MHPKYLSIKDFTYELPENKIAKYPLSQRDESKLLIYRDGNITESTYSKLDEQISPLSMLIFNNTKVVEARLLFKKSTGTIIELFCLEPPEQYSDITTAMLQKGKVFWKCLVGGAKKWKDEPLQKEIETENKSITLIAKKVETHNDHFLIEFSWTDGALTFAEILHFAGLIPLPPYLNRVADDNDKISYQTIYAKYDGSVAAPTAGLHFTNVLLEKLGKKNIQSNFVTLHVGAGTFKPVKAPVMQEHEMHAEFIEVKKEFIEDLLKNIDNKIIAVGTTSLRTVESLYWMGVKISERLKVKNAGEIISDDILIRQWDAYELPQILPAREALQYLLHWMNINNTECLVTKTQIIIAPGYTLKIAGALITNFHQPQSTLLLLVAAIAGDDWKKMYAYALAHDFRFLSYGDGSLIFKREE